MGAALLWDIPLRPQAIKNLNPQLMQPKRQKLSCTEHGRFRAHQEQWGSGPAHPAQAHQLTHSWQPQPEPTKGGFELFHCRRERSGKVQASLRQHRLLLLTLFCF